MTTYDTPPLFTLSPEVGGGAASPVGADARPTSGTHRRDDQPTSVAAAQSLDADTLHVELRRVLAIITNSGDRGATAGEVTAILRDRGFRRERGSIARRITDLRQGGLVTKTDETRRLDRKGARDEIVWEATR